MSQSSKQMITFRIAVMLTVVGCLASGRTARADRYGLVIGVGQYADSKLHRIPECRLDACRMAAVLNDHLGVPADRLTFLCDHGASRDNIEKAIRKGLGEKATHMDEVVIYFSGHMARSSVGDAALLPYDATLATKQNWIDSGELAQWLRDVKGKIVVIVDGAFAGGIETDALPGNVSVLASCLPNELSWTMVSRGGGVYTLLLVDAIRNGAAEAKSNTLANAHERAALEVTRYVRQKFQTHQTPPIVSNFPTAKPVDVDTPFRISVADAKRSN